MLCKKCGAEIPDDAAKCEFCGEIFREDVVEESLTDDMEETKVIDINNASENNIEDTASAEALEENTSEAEDGYEDLSQRSTHEIFEENQKRRKRQTEQLVDEKQQQLEEITMRRNNKKQKQKRNKIILICCVCALAIAAAGFGTYFVKNGGWNTSVIATPTPSSTPIPTLSPVSTPAIASTSPSPSATTATEAPEASSNVSSVNSSDSENTNSSDTNNASSGGTSGGSTDGSSSSNNSANSSTSSGGASSNATNSSNGSNSSNNSSTSNGTTNSDSSAVTNTNKYSGAVSDKIVSALVTGDKVIYDEPSNKYFMTFNMNGTMYYAHVSEGSTTEQVHGKSITITAEPTNGRYDGNTVYEITGMTYYDGDYILPDSGTRVINASEIQDFTKDKLGLARNEIYARHGRKFQMEVYQHYFNCKSWYKVNPNYDYTDDNKNLNSIELQNVSTILSVENSK